MAGWISPHTEPIAICTHGCTCDLCYIGLSPHDIVQRYRYIVAGVSDLLENSSKKSRSSISLPTAKQAYIGIVVRGAINVSHHHYKIRIII